MSRKSRKPDGELVNTPALLAETEKIEVVRSQLQAEGKFSLPPSKGRHIVIVSGASKHGWEEADYREFMAEAEQLVATRQAAGGYGEIVLVPHAYGEEIAGYVADPDVAGLTLIGHGTIERIFTDGGTAGRDFSWGRALQVATHLKRGRIEQLMCGHFPGFLAFCIPLGTPIVADLSDVRAALGQILPNEPVNPDILMPIFDAERPLGQQLCELNYRWLGVVAYIDANGQSTNAHGRLLTAEEAKTSS